MSLIWHDATKARRLSQSQPLRWPAWRADWVCVAAWAAVVALSAAGLWLAWLAGASAVDVVRRFQ